MLGASALSAQTDGGGQVEDIIDALQERVPGKGTVTVRGSDALRNMLGKRLHGEGVEKTDSAAFLKIQGYRTQVFSGNNQRKSKDEAFRKEKEIKELANDLGKSVEELKAIIESLKEFNPMMGHRGCRLAITYPEIAEMQTRAVIEAAINVGKKGIKVAPEIMIPLVGDVKELKYVKEIVVRVADEIIKNAGVDLMYEVGTMIEIPRAALLADKIAEEAQFFSFGTNDLTQMTYGFSRDDAGKFLESYYEKGIFESDPFARIDTEGVGELMRIASEKGRKTKKDLSLGICGEHGGDPSSIAFCDSLGFNYVSCSPFRVPIARLAAAQAAIKRRTQK